jgi:hypothetical protein
LVTLSEAIRKELTTLGMPTVLEMAIVSNSGKVLYSDLGKPAMNKISPFYESLLLMGLGDNLTLALDDTKTIVVSRVSNRAILVVITDKKVGIILTKMGGVGDKFGRLLDEVVVMEESKGVEGLPSAAVVAEAQPANPTATSSLPQVEIKKTEALGPPPKTHKEVATRPTTTAQPKTTERVIVPFLNDIKLLEKCPEKERKFLELFDGKLSLKEISGRLSVPFFDALKIANKYKNLGKVDMKEIIRG